MKSWLQASINLTDNEWECIKTYDMELLDTNFKLLRIDGESKEKFVEVIAHIETDTPDPEEQNANQKMMDRINAHREVLLAERQKTWKRVRNLLGESRYEEYLKIVPGLGIPLYVY